MLIREEDIRRCLRLGEDSKWEFKQIEFKGNKPKSPRREQLADEIGAFANANGGVLLCGVREDKKIQHMSSEQLKELSRMLVEACRDKIDPPLRIHIENRELDGKAFVLAEIPRGYSVHERDGKAYIRVVPAKHLMTRDEILRLSQSRAQSRYLWTDKQTVPDTGFETLSERLWEGLISAAGAENPRRGLANLGFLARDEEEIERATVAGVLLCTPSPQKWLPHACITATCYRGLDRASGQIDGREITGPLPQQIDDAIQFVVRNMRVSARKTPARIDLPQYSLAAVFEAVVNAVVHRDYSMSTRRIRLSMFKNRLEIESPGLLPNGMTIEAMEDSQSTRNEVIASAFGRIPVPNMTGSEHREFLMERRGDGVSIIRTETQKTSGQAPEYQLLDNICLVLRIPAAKLELFPADALVAVHCNGEPLAGIEVHALFPNKTRVKAATDESGEAALSLYTTNLPMTVFAAGKGYTAAAVRSWIPENGGLILEVKRLQSGGSAIFAQNNGYLPGLHGSVEPIRDASDRTRLYADNIAIDEGRTQPVPFRFGKPIRLTDSHGAELFLTIIDILGQSALVEYRPVKKKRKP